MAEGSSAEPLQLALAELKGQNGWPAQETCYSTLLKLLQNVVDKPEEPKFRSIKATNATIKAKVLDCAGARAFLLAAGFAEDGDLLTLPSGDDAAQANCGAALAALKSHANDCSDAYFREVRDAKITQAKADEAKLNEFGGFSRGLHNLRSSSSGKDAEAAASQPSPLPPPPPPAS
mmetsp:Transcript_47428/g.152282  ORF Transcript_47428/g.152282 Transcript_47428/m.152282 type:complete len:176 (+) Transcript_47428:129-656(+)